MATTQLIQKYMGQTMLIVKANGGSVTVEKQVGASWVVTDTFTRDVCHATLVFNDIWRCKERG